MMFACLADGYGDSLGVMRCIRRLVCRGNGSVVALFKVSYN